eukprot:c3002_g1_i1.p1 GENE.c3002_g1_i1~~c3002_g1_i1.p1  ORF type:complete len:372 (-),score=108.84 c3002_g1_i1:525-1640(-)
MQTADDKDVAIVNLKAELAAVRVKTASLEEQVKAAKKSAVQMQAKTEVEEEFITNRLMKRLDELQAEKEHLVKQVQLEEEHLANAMQKLNQLQQEKVQLQQQLEREEEYVVNKLQKQILQVTSEKRELERKLVEHSDALISTLHNGVQRVQQVETSLGPEQSLFRSSESMELVRAMTEQLEKMRTSQQLYMSDSEKYKKMAEEYQEKLKESDHKNFLLEQQVLVEQEKHRKLVLDACHAEQDMERLSEREINAVRRNSHSNSGELQRRGSQQSPRINSPSLGAFSLSSDPNSRSPVTATFSPPTLSSPSMPSPSSSRRSSLPPEDLLSDALARQAAAAHRSQFARKTSTDGAGVVGHMFQAFARANSSESP